MYHEASATVETVHCIDIGLDQVSVAIVHRAKRAFIGQRGPIHELVDLNQSLEKESTYPEKIVEGSSHPLPVFPSRSVGLSRCDEHPRSGAASTSSLTARRAVRLAALRGALGWRPPG